MLRLKNYSCEEPFVIALTQCNDEEEILRAIKNLNKNEVCINNMGMYDEFIKKNTNMKYCQGCQSYHNSSEVDFIDGSCVPQYNSMVELNEALYKQGEKNREASKEYYYK